MSSILQLDNTWKFQTDKESSSNASSRNAVLAVHFTCRKANLQCCCGQCTEYKFIYVFVTSVWKKSDITCLEHSYQIKSLNLTSTACFKALNTKHSKPVLLHTLALRHQMKHESNIQAQNLAFVVAILCQTGTYSLSTFPSSGARNFLSE